MPKYDVDVKLTNDVYENIRTCLTNSVKKRLMAERRIGCLLSGGLDSSLICGLVVQEARKLGLTEKYPIQTFLIGMDDSSPDILAARKVAEMLKTEHHEILFNETDVQNALLPVIKTLETYDVTLRQCIFCPSISSTCLKYFFSFNNYIFIIKSSKYIKVDFTQMLQMSENLQNVLIYHKKYFFSCRVFNIIYSCQIFSQLVAYIKSYLRKNKPKNFVNLPKFLLVSPFDP